MASDGRVPLVGRGNGVELADKVVEVEAAVKLVVRLVKVDLGHHSLRILGNQRAILCKNGQ